MVTTSPSLTTSASSPKTCARRVSVCFAGQGRTREVCVNFAQAGAARDRDLRAVDPVWHYERRLFALWAHALQKY